MTPIPLAYQAAAVAHQRLINDNTILKYFITTWDTEKVGSATKTIVIPTTGAGYNCWINWGDGGAEENAVGTPGNITHVYATTGIKTVKIRGLFPQIYFNNAGDKLKLLTIAQWGNIVWSSMANAFSGCANLTGTYTDTPNTVNVTRMDYIFAFCTVFNSPVNFNTAAVTDMTYMFKSCLVFNQSVASFDTSLVNTMNWMFDSCPVFNQPVNFNTALVTNMERMFQSCLVFNQSVTNFNVALVTTMANMLVGAFKMTTANYDALLIAWAAQAVKDNVPFHAGTATYTLGGAAAAARAHLVLAVASGGHAWTITDGGGI